MMQLLNRDIYNTTVSLSVNLLWNCLLRAFYRRTWLDLSYVQFQYVPVKHDRYNSEQALLGCHAWNKIFTGGNKLYHKRHIWMFSLSRQLMTLPRAFNTCWKHLNFEHYCFLIKPVLGYTYSGHIAILQGNSSKEEEVGQVPATVSYDLCKILFNMNTGLWRSQSHAVLRPSVYRDVHRRDLDIGLNVNFAIMSMCFVLEGLRLTWWLLEKIFLPLFFLNNA